LNLKNLLKIELNFSLQSNPKNWIKKSKIVVVRKRPRNSSINELLRTSALVKNNGKKYYNHIQRLLKRKGILSSFHLRQANPLSFNFRQVRFAILCLFWLKIGVLSMYIVVLYYDFFCGCSRLTCFVPI